MSSPRCPNISQSIYLKCTDVPVCTDGSVTVELVTWEHTHILTDHFSPVSWCVLIYVWEHTEIQAHLFNCASQIILKKKLDIYGNAVSGKYNGTIFPIAFAHFMSLSHFDNSWNISNHLIIIICIILICDQWFLMLLPYKCSVGQHSFSNKVLEIKVCLFFIYNAIVHH